MTDSETGESDEADEADDLAVRADVLGAFEAYEAALVANDVDALDGFMWPDARLVRIGLDDRQDGFEAVRRFRRAQARQTPPRTLRDTAVVTFGRSTAVVTTTFVPTDGSAAGRQQQTWVRLGGGLGWRIVAAHVSFAASAFRHVADPQP